MKIVFSTVLSISLLLSTVFGNTDFQNLMVGLHILTHSSDTHQHDHDSHHAKAQGSSHHHDHKASKHSHQNEQRIAAKSNLNSSSPFNIVHQHDNDDSHGDGEPHEHTFSTGTPFVSFLNPPYEVNLPNVDDMSLLSFSVDQYVQGPYLNGLFRPPIS